MSTLVEHTSRKDYHDKWDRIARDEVAKTEEEETAEALADKAKIGADKGPKSEAEAKDLEAREGLKKAKKLWQRRQDEEAAQRCVITEKDTHAVIDAARVGDANVVTIKGCENATVFLDKDLKLVKVFLEDCKECVVRLHCALVTSFVEVSRCEGVCLETAVLLHTVQCDICDRVTIRWMNPKVFDAAAPDGPRVYSAACTALCIDAGGGRLACTDNLDEAVDCGTAKDEQQFVTQFFEGALLTERVVQGTAKRLVGATQRELDAAGETPQTIAEEARADAEREKAAGNQAFSQREYGQAAVHYTVCLDKPIYCSGRPRAVLLANRSACFLKLGQHAQAEEDAAEAVAADATYCKGHFRQGLAMHAQRKYVQALPCLGRARDLEPKNKQILDAIKFAEMKLAQSRAAENRA